MKKSIQLTAFILTIIIAIYGMVIVLNRIIPTDDDTRDEPAKEATATDGYTFEGLLDAIEWVESKGDTNAIGDNGNAVGCMQIHKICVDDVNRILGDGRYTYDDRYSRVHSRYMAFAYLYHYANNKGFEAAARIWNGGPRGHMKESTKPYWLKVKARMEKP